MTKENLIAVGHYYDWDIEPMQAEYNLHSVIAGSDIASLDSGVLASTRAVAFKGHSLMGAAEMDLLPNLGIIGNYGVGYDIIDVVAAAERGVKVTNTPNVLNDDVADLAVAMLIAQSREIVQSSDWVRSGNWENKGDFRLARKVSGGKAGIVGLGRIGREIADRLAAFKIDIHYHSRSKKEVPDGWTYHADPVSLASAVDYLFVVLVGGTETAGFVSREVLEALGSDGILVNVSRGSTVDEGALLDMLESGGLRGAALDVFASEPNIDPRFLKLENVLVQPHQGSATAETRQAMGQLQRDNIAAYFAGLSLLTPVN